MPAFFSKFQKLPISEWILVQKVKLGDKEAFGTLYSFYLDKIFRYIFFRVNQQMEVAEDLTEVSFIKAWEKIDLYKKEGGSFSSWIYTIARNTVIDYFREHNRLTSLSEDQIDGENNAEEKIMITFEIERVQEAMKYLTVEQQEIITLKFINDMSNKEIAIFLGKKEDAIRALQYRALQELRKRLV
ncbi:MAG: sigma-70 family RNA polymerase sigma factor [Patescibacteria group bacterium]|nr:sigma-70 family RNA polymerase sigma factor [Patescibacteria group bacterium]